ncbi:hypothetical protein ACH4RG_23190 [Streptomyces sp. NPDC021019]|uniref:hypothetical protein n=1 Tax=Streptomyces sp. NPDC021019 TaxID=3365108 RepID=UPI0037BB6964
MQTFTFPSGTTVDLPEGMTLCRQPETVTFDCARVVPVGDTPAGRRVFSSFSCAAYARAADVHSKRRDVAEREHGLNTAARNRRRVTHLVEHLAHHRRVLDRMLTAYADDPAPCTCP